MESPRICYSPQLSWERRDSGVRPLVTLFGIFISLCWMKVVGGCWLCLSDMFSLIPSPRVVPAGLLSQLASCSLAGAPGATAEAARPRLQLRTGTRRAASSWKAAIQIIAKR